jgi:hypothetical protein
MIRPGSFTSASAVGAAIAAIVVGTAMLTVSWTLARPAQLHSREATLAAEASTAAGLLQESDTQDDFSRGALCTSDPSAASQALGQALQDAARRQNLALSNMKIEPVLSSAAPRSLTPVSVNFEASGPYDAAVRFLGELARARPEVFVDTMDLKSQSSAVSFQLAGWILCSVSPVR